MIGAPSARSMAATVLLPQAMPPVSPITRTPSCLPRFDRGVPPWYREPMRALGLLLVVLAVAPPPSEAARADWTGSQACGACHPAALAVWRSSAHGQATVSLGRHAADGRCLGCHSTGDAPAGRPAEPAVGCEACHGAGAAYAPADVMRDPVLARELGLRDLDTPARRRAVCGACHRPGAGTRLTPFDAERAWARIRHGP
jgi:cytochrome c554/c'-like protein